MIRLENFVFSYKPFPVGVARPFIEPALYESLAATYPTPEVFARFREDSSGRYSKFSLSARNNGRQLVDFLDRHPAWRRLYEYFYSGDFVDAVLDHLERHDIQVVRRRSSGLARRLNRLAPKLSDGRLPRVERLLYSAPRKLGGISSKVEFSALPATDGGLMPHTDAEGKLVTLVIAFPTEGEWRDEFGGGTSIVEPKDERRYFNRFNRTLPFDEVDVLRVVEYRPNQAMLFIKTFNSWHAVMPTHGPAGQWRKTMTVNIMGR